MVPRCHEAEVRLRKERAEESPATTQLRGWRELARKGVMEACLWLPTVPTAPLRRGRRSASCREPRHLFIYLYRCRRFGRQLVLGHTGLTAEAAFSAFALPQFPLLPSPSSPTP